MKLTLTLTVEYNPDGTKAEELKALLDQLVQEAVNNGRLTGETPATVESYHHDITCESLLTREQLKDHQHGPTDGSWWEHDAQGIALCRVCDECRDAKLSRYRPEILTGYSQRDVDEPIEPE
jgi:hypothetical protein